MPSQKAIHQLPANYQEVRCFVATDAGILFTLNVLAFGLLVLGFGAMLGWIALTQRFNLWWPLVDSQNVSSWLLWLGVIAVFPLHEWVHGIAIRYTGHKPRYGLISTPVWKLKIPVALYATADDAYFRRDEFILITLLPLIMITVLGMLLLSIVGTSLAWYVILAVSLNAGGAVGDLWMAAIVLRYLPDVLVKDEADRIRIFSKVNE
jgi:hypothetical protein